MRLFASQKLRQQPKRLKFNLSQLRTLAQETLFSLDEIVAIYEAFRAQAGNRKPLEGGLKIAQILGVFGLEHSASFLFAKSFASLFWVKREEGKEMEVGFEEFVRVLSVWIRGKPSERLSLFFRMFDRTGKGYVSKRDIIEYFQSMLSLCLVVSECWV
eukprot:GHVQ01017821.1.p1 GENE.GHVQ01017821.1~~GHVQ01017821.1.p1  ORF type:complete len:158 (+),score=8.22 GHVQ01017821.1:596-1069(+)